MQNKTINFTNTKELETLIDSNQIPNSEQVLVQIFCGKVDTKCIEEIQKTIQKKLPKIHLIGTTTDGVIEGKNIYFDAQSVATFSIFEETKIKSVLLHSKEFSNDAYTLASEIEKRLYNDDMKVVIAFADGVHTNSEDFAMAMDYRLPSVKLAGGLAGDNGDLKETFVFDKYTITNDGLVAASLSNKHLQVYSNYIFDWFPIGKKMTVTKAVKNRVYELDNTPVVGIYEKYMGKALAQQLPKTGIEFPLIYEKDGVRVGRAVLAKHPDGSLTFAGNLEEGTEVRFGIGDALSILKNGSYKINSFLETTPCRLDALFVYSCMARRRFLDEYASYELNGIAQITDVAGFFTYGEFYTGDHSKQLLNETMTFLGLSEGCDRHKIDYNDLDLSYYQKLPVMTTQQVLANLANTVSSELADLNEHLEERVKEISDYIYKQAYMNDLTGLPNRLSLIRELDDNIGKVLFLINIDDFTTINDFYGHLVGDKVLRQLAAVLRRYAEEKGFSIYKLPSDEFAMILDIPHDKESIVKHVEEINQRVEEEQFHIMEYDVHVSVTISASLINQEKTGLVNADMALKLAKARGENFIVFDEDLKLSQRYEENINTVKNIKYALTHDGVVPYFQPIFDIKTLDILKYEALIRIRTGSGAILSPYEFLEVSQKIKMYEKLVIEMIDKTFSFFSKNKKDFSFNVGFYDIKNKHLRRYLFEKIQEYDVAGQLTLEILETDHIEDEKIMQEFTDEVYASGAKIAIDDFGSGYANFEYMTKIKSDYMKIDGSLIRNIDKDENSRLITETIVGFAKKLGKKTIAEFVHSQEVFNIVKELGIDYVQGYYLGTPQPEV